jgi:hypothetical protein
VSTLVATYLIATIVVLASLLVGRAFLLVLGRRQASYLEGAVGIGILLIVCSIAIRLPGDTTTSLLASGVLVAASLIFLISRDESIFGPGFGVAAPVALLSALIASLPFITSGHIGIPGVGLNNDMAQHLVDTDYLVNPTGPKPSGIVNGYPIGPQSVAGSVATLLGQEPLRGFLGLLVALPVLLGITSLGALRDLPGWRRILGGGLVAGAYLTASVLGISGFKELLLGMFLIAFALGLREIERNEEGMVAVVAGLAVITVATVPVYGFPGLAWLGLTFVAWAVAELVVAERERPGNARELLRRSKRYALPALGVLVVLGVALLPRAIDFIDSGAISTVRHTDSKLRFIISPFETLGIWPSGNWLLGTSDVSHYWIFGLIGLAGLTFGLIWWLRKRDLALPAAVAAAIIVYVGIRATHGGLYIQAKALVVPASLVMLVALSALLAPGGGWLKRGLTVVFVALAAYSSFLALRDSIVAPDNRAHELAGFRSTIDGQRVLSLTSDRFTDYYLRSSEVFSPSFNAENRVSSQVTKDQRLPIDFDSVPTNVLNEFPYALTTSAAYQSHAPPGWTLVKQSESYKLWKRTGTTPPIAILYEEARPGRVFRCNVSRLTPFRSVGGEAFVWPRPQIAKRPYWKIEGKPNRSSQGGLVLPPGQKASQTIQLGAGTYDISLQYVTPVAGVTVSAPGLDEHVPAGVDAAIPYRADQGPYWPVGQMTTSGGPVTFTVQADQVDAFQRLLGVDNPAVIGNLTAVKTTGFETLPTASACSRYVDHLINAPQLNHPRFQGHAPSQLKKPTG